MSYTPLSDLHDWNLVHADQDIRGWKVVDATGEVACRVDELLVDTDSQLVEAIRLDNGDIVQAEDIEIGDRVVYLRGIRPSYVEEEREPVAQAYRNRSVRREYQGLEETERIREPASAERAEDRIPDLTGTPGTLGGRDSTERRTHFHEPVSVSTFFSGFTELNDEFRSHHKSVLSDTGRAFAIYEPAYAHGYSYSVDDSYRDREYSDIEAEMRQRYEREHPHSQWDDVKDAACHGFNCGRNARKG